MPAKASGKIKTRIIHSPQKNGDIYVLERKTVYDSEKKYNKVLSTKLISKIPKGTKIPVPTRPKRAKKSNSDQNIYNVALKNAVPLADEVVASRKRVGMMNIIDHIGKVSGIDDAIYTSTDVGTAQKIISLARYLLATDGQSLPGMLLSIIIPQKGESFFPTLKKIKKHYPTEKKLFQESSLQQASPI